MLNALAGVEGFLSFGLTTGEWCVLVDRLRREKAIFLFSGFRKRRVQNPGRIGVDLGRAKRDMAACLT
ncbi:MAG: hypothetical protein ACLVLH_08015 [Eisenbergiella massiliensis]